MEDRPPIRVVVSGSGKMGREVLGAVGAQPNMRPVGVIEKLSQEAFISLPGGIALPMSADPAEILSHQRPDVVVDFTNADWTPHVAEAALDVGSRLVIGTTGLPANFLQRLEERCAEERVGAVVASNFAIGAVLMMHFAEVAARFFDVAEIIELHHDQKVDAPSGTAKTTAEAMLRARGGPFRQPSTEKEIIPGTRGGALDGVTIHSVRLPGLVAHQEVIFGGQGQTLTIRHDTSGRESFMPGVVMAVNAVMELDHLVLGLDHLVGL